MTTAYIALGSNVGDRLGNMADAVAAIAELPGTHVERASHVYESEAAYVVGQPLFANAVVSVETESGAEQLLSQLQQIELDMGRVRAEENGPRIIDLDILLFGEEEIGTDALVVPHPRLLERDFVVTPLLDVAPRLHLPDGTRVSHDGAKVGLVVDDLGPIPDLGRITNAPVFASNWVPVAEGTRNQDLLAGWDTHLQFQREALEEAGIPYAWDPYEPESSMDPFGMPTTFTLLVPTSDVARAAALLADLDAAEIEPEQFEGEE
jgi:2-amino-4-hydroxy-6-hydroxymethyldihydropteridine diphosphokinase